MRTSLISGLSLTTLASTSQRNAICPILGPPFPHPKALSHSSHFTNATATIDTAIATALRTDNSSVGTAAFNATSFSIGVLSTPEPGLLYERHHLAPDAANSSTGTKILTAVTVYRVGNVS